MKWLKRLGWLVAAGFLSGRAAAAPDPRTEGISYQNAGYFYSQRGDRARTDENYRKAIAIDPKGKGYRLSYGWALYNLHDYPAALAVWHDAFAGVDREYLNRAICLALVHHQLGHHELAIEWYQLQCLVASDFASLPGLRQFTRLWQPGEQKVAEELYQLWRREKDASDKLRPNVRAKARTWEEEQKTPVPHALPPAAFKTQQAIDESFAVELKKAKTIIRPGSLLVLPLTVRPDGTIQVDSHAAENATFEQPLYFALAMRALNSFAGKTPALPPAGNPSLGFPARFEVQFAADSPP